MKAVEQLVYKVENFEGPLDLLLKLISKNKLSIYEIEISDLLDQYMQQISLLKQQQMEVSSSFLEMAARLVYIKTAQLLPKYESEAEKLKEELTSQIVEYSEYKRVAEVLLSNLNMDFFCRQPMKIKLDLTYKGIHSIAEVCRTYIDLIDCVTAKALNDKSEKEDHLEDIVKSKSVSVFSKVVYVLRCLYKYGKFCFEDLFLGGNEKSDLIAFFLAILELIKCNRISIQDKTSDILPSDICLKKWRKRKYRV